MQSKNKTKQNRPFLCRCPKRGTNYIIFPLPIRKKKKKRLRLKSAFYGLLNRRKFPRFRILSLENKCFHSLSKHSRILFPMNNWIKKKKASKILLFKEHATLPLTWRERWCCPQHTPCLPPWSAVSDGLEGRGRLMWSASPYANKNGVGPFSQTTP